MNKQIRIVVEKDGKLRLKVEGVSGSQCLLATEFLEKEIGEVFERQRTSDFYKAREITLTNRITSGNMVA